MLFQDFSQYLVHVLLSLYRMFMVLPRLNSLARALVLQTGCG